MLGNTEVNVTVLLHTGPFVTHQRTEPCKGSSSEDTWARQGLHSAADAGGSSASGKVS